MKAGKIIITILISLFSYTLPFKVVAQIDQEQQLKLKYWLYRHNLQTKFMIGTGGGFGKNMPASIRESRYKMNLNPLGGFWGSVKWGDGTIDLAYYISVLALEYNANDQNGISNAVLVNELGHAINTINRLDYYAEELWGVPNSLNGFFVRDDVGKDLTLPCLHDDDKPNYSPASFSGVWPLLDNLNEGSTVQPRDINDISSGWTAYCYQDGKRYFNHEESKDQIIHLVYALSLVKALVPNSLNFPNGFMDNNSNFHVEVENIYKRIFTYIHGKYEPNGIHNWDINRPVPFQTVVHGHNLYTLAYGYSRCLKKLTGENNPCGTCQVISNGWKTAMAIFLSAWKVYPATFLFKKPDGWKMLALVAASGCCQANSTSIYLNSAVYDNKYGFYNANYHVPGLWRIVQGGLDKTPSSVYRTLLDEAPCENPYNFKDKSNGDMWMYPNFNWSATSLLVHPEGRGQPEACGFPGVYNGLDYMLLYGLSRYSGTNLSFNHYDYKEFYNAPHPAISLGWGGSQNKKFVAAINSIYSDKNIASDGFVTYKSKNIEVQNATFELGSTVELIAEDVLCGNSGFSKMQNTNSSVEILEYFKLPDTKEEDVVFVFPSPTNDVAVLKYAVPENSTVSVVLLDCRGVVIKSILNKENLSKGSYYTEITSLSEVSKGIYFIQVQCSSYCKTIKLIKN